MKIGDLVFTDRNNQIYKILDEDSKFFTIKHILHDYIYYKEPKEWFRLATPEEIAEIIAEKLK